MPETAEAVQAPITQTTPPTTEAQTTPAPQTAPVASPAPVAEIPKQDPQLSARFNQLARKEREIHKRAVALKQREEVIRAQSAKVEDMEAMRSLATSDPIAFMERFGLNYQQVTDFVLNNKQPTADLKVKQLETRLEKMQREQEEKQRQIALQQKQEAERTHAETIEAVQEEITDFVDRNQEKYELIKSFDSQGLVFSTINAYFDKTRTETGKGRILSYTEACDMVEDYLTKLTEKATSSKKWKARGTPPPQNKEEPTTTLKEAPTRTLNNQLATTTPISTPAKTEADAMRRALAKLNEAKAV